MEYFYKKRITLHDDIIVKKVTAKLLVQCYKLVNGTRFQGDIELIINEMEQYMIPFDLIIKEKCSNTLKIKKVYFLQNGCSLCLKFSIIEEKTNMEEIYVDKKLNKTQLSKDVELALEGTLKDVDYDVISTEVEEEYTPISITQEVNLTPVEEKKVEVKNENLFKESYEVYASFYRVKKGDTWESVANKHQLTIEQLKKNNPNAHFEEGHLLRITK